MRSLRLASAVCFAAALLASPAAAGPIQQIIVFGDSLSDTGNVFAATGGQFPPPAYGYDNGRFSNGPVWVERLANRLGVGAPTPSLTGGSNYAFGGATSATSGYDPLTSNGQLVGFVPSIGTQISTYLAGHTPGDGKLYTVWGGANDFFNGQTNPSIPAANIAANVQTLLGAGARNFLVANMPPLDVTPFGLSLSLPEQAGLRALSVGFNQALAADLAQLQSQFPDAAIHQLDIFDLVLAAEADPAAFGLTNVTDEALFVKLFDPNADVSGFLFWDDVHPASRGHEIVGDAAFGLLIPEPSSMALFAAGAAGLAGLGWLRRLRAA
jgi:outer membrane lipase/esterase